MTPFSALKLSVPHSQRSADGHTKLWLGIDVDIVLISNMIS